MSTLNLNEEKRLWQKGLKRVAGLDEVGRGPLAGPVMAAAVAIQNPRYKILDKNIKDSKKLTPKQREKFYKILTKCPEIKGGIGKVSEKIIDRINIKNASELAMEKALKNLEKKIKAEVDFLIIDGNHLKNCKLKNKNHKLMVKADEKVFSCAAASIIAKVERDRLMKTYNKKYPQYGFDRHKGYGTKRHQSCLKKYGPCKIHRKSFTLVN
jgi:ribonuclease HII